LRRLTLTRERWQPDAQGVTEGGVGNTPRRRRDSAMTRIEPTRWKCRCKRCYFNQTKRYNGTWGRKENVCSRNKIICMQPPSNLYAKHLDAS
jgi:hypothetical protein